MSLTGQDLINLGNLIGNSIKSAMTPAESSIVNVPSGRITATNTQDAINQLQSFISLPAIPGISKNLKVTNGVNPNTQVLVTADYLVLTNSSGLPYVVTNVNVPITITNSGAGGLDTGSLTGSTWYYVWIGYNPTTGTTNGWISTSATSSTVPAGYTYYAKVYGAPRTDGTVNKYLYRFLTTGNKTQYVITTATNTALMPLMVNGVQGTYSSTAPTWATISVSNFVPSTASRIHLVATNNYENSTLSSVIVAPNNNYNGVWSATGNVPIIVLSAANVSTTRFEFTLESSNVYMASNNTGAALYCCGWEEIA